MTGVSVPVGALGAGVALGSTLPYTGWTLAPFVIVAVGLVLLGIALRVIAAYGRR